MKTLEGNLVGTGLKFALVASRFNSLIAKQLEEGAIDALVRHGVAAADIELWRVPGTFELPPAVRRAALSGKFSGVVALGCLVRGSTAHFDLLASEVTRGIGAVASEARCAVTFGVIACDTLEQAIERAGTKQGNKGAEAALACLEVANLLRLG